MFCTPSEADGGFGPVGLVWAPSGSFLTKDVNGYSNICIRSEYSNTISEFEYSHLLSVPAFFLSFFYFFVFFLQNFQTQNYRLVLKGG